MFARASNVRPFVSIDTPLQNAGYAHPVTVGTNVESLVSNSPEQTEMHAAAVVARLRPGDVVLLSGELGAGKTTFVRGAARALGVDAPVTSPSFTIGNIYAGTAADVAHVDLYRLHAIDSTDEAVLDDFLGAGRITFIEWPHDELADLDAVRGVVTLAHVGGDRRDLRIEWRANGGPA